MKWIQRAWVAAVALACFTWLMSESDQTTVALLLSAVLVSSLGVPRGAPCRRPGWHAAARGAPPWGGASWARSFR